jgi:hypothetical protein
METGRRDEPADKVIPTRHMVLSALSVDMADTALSAETHRAGARRDRISTVFYTICGPGCNTTQVMIPNGGNGQRVVSLTSSWLAQALEHRRDAGDRLGVQHAFAHDPEPPGPFGDQQVAVGEERECICRFVVNVVGVDNREPFDQMKGCERRRPLPS